MLKILAIATLVIPSASAFAQTKIFKCETLPDAANQRRVVIEVTDVEPLPLMKVHRQDVSCTSYASLEAHKVEAGTANFIKIACDGDTFELRAEANADGKYNLNENLTISGRNWTLKHACELEK